MMGFAALYPSYDSLTPRTGVVPAKAGTHNHRELLYREQVVAAEHITKACGYGSRVKPGTTRGEITIQISNSREDVSRHSRGMRRPSFVSLSTLSKHRGRRESRVLVAPVGPVQQKARG